MTNHLHRAAIAERMTRFLRRRTQPRHLAADEAAAAAEIESLVRRCAEHAPTSPETLAEWWPRFERRLEDLGNGRHWPTPKEVGIAASTTPKARITPVGRDAAAVGSWEWTLDIKARRITEGTDFTAHDVWGPVAVELLRTGRITEEQLTRARQAVIASWVGAYGEQTAACKAAEMADCHASAERMWDDRRGPRRNAPQERAATTEAVARVLEAATCGRGLPA